MCETFGYNEDLQGLIKNSVTKAEWILQRDSGDLRDMIFNGTIRDDLDLTIRSEFKKYSPEESIDKYGAKDSTEIGLKFK